MEGPRAARESEFKELISLINRDFRTGTDQDIRTDYPLVFNHSMLDFLRIIKDDGKVVSQVPILPRQVIASDDRFTIGDISPTITHPDYRHRGYGTLCLRDCNRIATENCWPISVLWTLEPTFPFYQHSGFAAVASQGWVYKLIPEDSSLFEKGQFEIIKYNPQTTEYLDDIIKIHDAEPYRIDRTPIQYKALSSLPKINLTLAIKQAKVAAYLIFGEGINKPGIIEAGGSTAAVESILNTLLKDPPHKEIEAQVPFTPTTLGKILQSKKLQTRLPIEQAKGHGYQMMRINSMDKFFRKITNYLNRKSAQLQGNICLVCKESGETVTLKLNKGCVDISNEPLLGKLILTRRQLAQLIFGHHPKAKPVTTNGKAGKILKKLFPFYFPVWQLDHS